MSTKRVGASSIGGAAFDINDYLTKTNAAALYVTKTDAATLYADKTPFQSASPTLPDTGQLWVDSDTNELYVYSGSAWILVSAGGGGGASKSSILFLAGM